ncbi:hypothetical protein CLU79DRAFT_122338 [Phycomyces nitens]|nr:hypothetical protein CLU79DRAFT_122338 [Phycomyces nitens]
MVFILLSLWILSQKVSTTYSQYTKANRILERIWLKFTEIKKKEEGQIRLTCKMRHPKDIIDLQPRYRTACMSFGQWSIRTATHASIFIFNKSFDYIGYISLSRRKYPDLTHNNTVDPANDPPLKLIQVKQNDNTVVRRKKEKSGRSRTKRSEARSHTSGFREPSVQAVHAIIGPPPAPSLETGSIDTRDNKPSPKPHPNDDNEWTIVRERSFKRRIGPSICHQDQPEKKGVENEPQTNKVVPDIKPDTRILPCDITSSILCKEDPNSVSETFEDRFQVESDGESTLNDDYDDETLDRSECSLLTADDVLILDDYSQTVTNTSKDLAFIYGENKQYLDPPCLSKEQAPKDNGMDSKLITEQKWYSPFSTGFNLVQLCDDSQRPWDCPRPPLVCKSLAEKPVSYFDHWSKNYVWGNPCIGIHSNEKAPLDSLLYKKPFLLPLPEAHSASLSKLNSPLHQSSISQNYILPFTNRRATSAPLLFSQSSTYLQTTYKPRHSTQNEGIKAHFL